MIVVDSRAWVRLVGRNGRILMASEVYDSPSNARRAARRLGTALGLPFVEA